MQIARLLSIPGVSDVSIAGATTTAAIPFVWPAALDVEAMILLPRSGALADLAALSIQIVDEEQRQFTLDGIGSSNFVPGLSLHGMGFRWFPMRHRVTQGDRWSFTLTNGAVGAIVPTLLFRVRPR